MIVKYHMRCKEAAVELSIDQVSIFPAAKGRPFEFPINQPQAAHADPFFALKYHQKPLMDCFKDANSA